MLIYINFSFDFLGLDKVYFKGVVEDLSQQWTVQRQSNHGFSSVACDMAIEQTINRDSKTKGGTAKYITSY
jgi:hypothetical protein